VPLSSSLQMPLQFLLHQSAEVAGVEDLCVVEQPCWRLETLPLLEALGRHCHHHD
jgi:hypothetical protein